MALARELHKEADALVQAGCKIIQVDEPALSVRPGELPVAIEAMKTVTQGLPAYFITHICYGAFEFVYPEMLKMGVQNIDIELANSESGLLALFADDPFTKDVSLGVFDVHARKADSAETMRRRIKKALTVLNPEQVWIDPDCGLKTRTGEEARSRLAEMMKAVTQARKEL
jgi:5-methyltetrahydropteroyltriglutamate--homocysteine methyltransferase